jgi:hypothetical protein
MPKEIIGDIGPKTNITPETLRVIQQRVQKEVAKTQQVAKRAAQKNAKAAGVPLLPAKTQPTGGAVQPVSPQQTQPKKSGQPAASPVVQKKASSLPDIADLTPVGMLSAADLYDYLEYGLISLGLSRVTMDNPLARRMLKKIRHSPKIVDGYIGATDGNAAKVRDALFGDIERYDERQIGGVDELIQLYGLQGGGQGQPPQQGGDPEAVAAWLDMLEYYRDHSEPDETIELFQSIIESANNIIVYSDGVTLPANFEMPGDFDLRVLLEGDLANAEIAAQLIAALGDTDAIVDAEAYVAALREQSRLLSENAAIFDTYAHLQTRLDGIAIPWAALVGADARQYDTQWEQLAEYVRQVGNPFGDMTPVGFELPTITFDERGNVNTIEGEIEDTVIWWAMLFQNEHIDHEYNYTASPPCTTLPLSVWDALGLINTLPGAFSNPALITEILGPGQGMAPGISFRTSTPYTGTTELSSEQALGMRPGDLIFYIDPTKVAQYQYAHVAITVGYSGYTEDGKRIIAPTSAEVTATGAVEPVMQVMDRGGRDEPIIYPYNIYAEEEISIWQISSPTTAGLIMARGNAHRDVFDIPGGNVVTQLRLGHNVEVDGQWEGDPRNFLEDGSPDPSSHTTWYHISSGGWIFVERGNPNVISIINDENIAEIEYNPETNEIYR